MAQLTPPSPTLHICNKASFCFFRIALEHMTYLDGNRKIQRLTNGSVAIPIINGATQTLSDNISVGADIEYICRMALPQSKKVTQITPRAKLLRSLKTLLKERQIMWTTEIEKDVAVAWERRGDLVLLPHNSFQLSVWKRVGKEVSLWLKCCCLLGFGN